MSSRRPPETSLRMAHRASSRRFWTNASGLLLLAAWASSCADLIGADEWTPKADTSSSGTAGAGPGSTAGGPGGGTGQSSASSSTSGDGGAGGGMNSSGGGGGASSSSAGSGGGGGSSTSSSSSGGGGAGGMMPTCMDGIQNGTETDADCGGGACPPCSLCKACNIAADCQTQCCNTSVCANLNFNSAQCDPTYTCPDGCLNGTETDLDCGGTTCPTQCLTGDVCKVHSDCNSGFCDPSTKLCN